MNRRARPGKPKPLVEDGLAGKPWFLLPEKPCEDLLSSEDWVALGTTFGLTIRELNVAVLIFEDRTRSSIGRRLKRRPAGIRKRIDKVYKKLNVKGKLGLVQRLWHVHAALHSSLPNPSPQGKR